MLDPSTQGYARDPKMDRAGLINPGEVGSRSLCALLRIEDALTAILDRMGVSMGEPAEVVATVDLTTPLLVEIRDLLAAGPKPVKTPRGPKADTASEG